MSIKQDQIPKKPILYHSFPLSLYAIRFPKYIQNAMGNTFSWNMRLQRSLCKGKYVRTIDLRTETMKIDLRVIQRHCKTLKRAFNVPQPTALFTRLPRIENVYVDVENEKSWRVLVSKKAASCITIRFPLQRAYGGKF